MDHFDGEYFFNPEGARRDVSRLRAFKWLIRRGTRAPWPKRRLNRHFAPPHGAVAPGHVVVTFIGHSSFLLRLPGLTLLTDPIFSERCSPLSFIGPRRVRAPGQAIAALPRPDGILLSHNHYDHCDLPSLHALRHRFGRMPIYAPLGNKSWLEAKGLGPVIALDWWQSATCRDMTITLTPARHFAARTLRDRNTTLWGGFMIDDKAGTARIYFAGDTGFTAQFALIRARLGTPDLALLPIGAYEPRWFMETVHMNPDDAVRAFQVLGARRAIGMHFGTFQLTDEPVDAPLEDLATARYAANLTPDQFDTLDFGETRQFNLRA